MGRIARRLVHWLRWRHHDAALQEELDFHQSMKEQELEREGLTRNEARFAARRQIGNATRAREDSRAVWIVPWLEGLRQDTTYAVGSLKRQPGFAAASLIVLGIAIGLNASLFTVFAGLVLRPMAGLSDPARVVTVSGVNPPGIGGTSGLSFPEYAFLASQSKTFAGLAAFHPMSVRLEAAGTGRSTASYLVTANYFDVLGVRMEHGRGFLPGENRRATAHAVAVLSYALWQTRFGGDPAVVGKEVRINGMPFTVVGIAPRAFLGPAGAAQRIWLPISMMPVLRPNDPFATGMLDRAQDCCVSVTGRLAGTTTESQGQAEVEVLGRRFRASVGQPERTLVLGGTQFISGRRAAGTVLAIVSVLFLGVLLVLLIACANVGNLLLARAAARLGEIGVRLSLGAGRSRIVRQLLTEGCVLAFCASVMGVLVAMWLPPIALRLLSGEARPFDLDLDRWVLLYALVLAAISCLAFALAPALHATRFDIAAALKDDAHLLKSRFPLRSTLLAVQVAVSVVLLTSASLLLRGVAQARILDPGFRVDNVAVAAIDVPETTYDQARSRALLADVTAALRATRVRRFGFVSTEPLDDSSNFTGMRLRSESPQQTRTIEFISVSPGSFATLGIPILEGRDFVDADQGSNVVIVNQSMARQNFSEGRAVGQAFFGMGGPRLMEIVGIVADTHVANMKTIEPVLFVPPGENPLQDGRLPRLLFATDDPSTASTIAATIERFDPNARVEITPLRDRLESWLGDLALAPLMASSLGVFALGVATVGMFGVFSYVIRQRTREIGIRVAMGASGRDVIRLVLASSSRAVLVGLGVGALGAIGASQVLRSALYGLSSLDPIAYGAVLVLLAAAALAASYVPARRALNIDPVRALRYH
jgi:predicted permease